MLKTTAFAVLCFTAAACASAPPPEPPPTGPGPGEMGGICGGIAGFACRVEGAYCDYQPDQYRIADGAGVCRAEPEICTAEYAPVCGFDGRSYGNACNAAMEGVSVLAEGLCPGDRGTTAQ